MINVLITGVGSLLGQSLFRSLKKTSFNTHVIGADYFSHAVGLYWVDKGYILPDILSPRIDENCWLNKIREIIHSEKINVILVGLDFEIEIFSRNKKQIEAETGVKIVVGEPDKVSIGADKWKTVEFLKENNLPYPKSSLPESIDSFLSQNSFPFIVKPRFGYRSRSIFIVDNMESLKKAIDKCSKPVVQEVIGTSDNEFTCGIVYLNKSVLSTISLKRDLRDGNTVRTYSSESRELDEFIKKVGNCLKMEGPANFQFRIDSNGSPVIFEINPRFSGTTFIRTLFGINELEILLRALLFEEYVEVPEKRHGVVLRYFDEQYIPWDQFNSIGSEKL